MEEENLETKIDNIQNTNQFDKQNISQKEEGNKKKNNKSQEELENVDNVKEEETKIKEDIQKRLKEKIKESGYWTEEQIDKTSNIMENQTKMVADYIYDMGKDRLGNKYQEAKSKKYFDKLKNKCMDITEYETMVNPFFNMEDAIKKEEEIKRKLEAGEITQEEALKAYSEPVKGLDSGMLKALQKIGIKTYEDMYKEMKAKEETKDKSKSFRESLTNGVPTLEAQAENSKVFQEKIATMENDRTEKTSDDLSK